MNKSTKEKLTNTKAVVETTILEGLNIVSCEMVDNGADQCVYVDPDEFIEFAKNWQSGSDNPEVKKLDFKNVDGVIMVGESDE